MSRKKHYQFFTTDMNLIRGTWFPMDHFFYAPNTHDPNTGCFLEKGKLVHLEAHASIRHPNGWCVDVIQGEGKNAKVESFDDYPSALRRMADIIEAHEKKRKR